MKRLKHVADLNAGQSPLSDDVIPINGGLPFLQGNAEFGAESPTARYECPSAPKRARPGDFLVSVRAPVGQVNVADREYGIGRGLCAIRPRLVDSRFLWWWLFNSAPLLNSLATGTTFTAVSAGVLGSVPMTDHDLHEQRTIADYLDRETDQIDELIGKQDRLTKLLRERRGAVMDGLIASDDSENVPLRYMMRELCVGIVVRPSDWYVDSGVPALRGTNVRPGYIDESNLVYLSPQGHSLHDRSRLRENDVVIVRTGQAGTAATAPPHMWGYNAVDLLIARPNGRLDPNYLVFLLNSPKVRRRLALEVVGTIQGHFNVGALNRLSVPIPPLVVQRHILAEWKRKSEQIDALIAKAEQFIALARERRSALITAAVTGQIDVRAAS